MLLFESTDPLGVKLVGYAYGTYRKSTKRCKRERTWSPSTPAQAPRAPSEKGSDTQQKDTKDLERLTQTK